MVRVRDTGTSIMTHESTMGRAGQDRAEQGRGDLRTLSSNAIVHVHNDRRTNWPAMYFVASVSHAHAHAQLTAP